MLRGIAVLVAVVSLAACGNHKGGGGGEVLFDQEFASRCDAFEAVSGFALAKHVEKTEGARTEVRKAVANGIAKEWKIGSSNASPDNCADLEDLASRSNGTISPGSAELYRDALARFVRELDPHSFYLNPDEAQKYVRSTANEDFGIGVALKNRLLDHFRPIQTLEVEDVFPGSPAWGVLKPGDLVTSINGKSLAGLELGAASKLIRDGSSTVSLEIQGREGPIDFNLRKYKSSPVSASRFTSNGLSVGVLRVRGFSKETASRVREGIRSLEESGDSVAGYFIDLRVNGGGSLEEARAMVDLFVDEGVIVTTVGKPGVLGAERFSARESGQETAKPTIVLVDPGTASASEIVSGALAGERALVVGEQTFGKGTGQEVFSISEKNGLGGILGLTMFRYYFADGFSPQAVGVTPHFVIPNRALEMAVGERRAQGAAVILHEKDYGSLTVGKDSASTQAKPRGALLEAAQEISKRMKDDPDWAECAPERDCTLDMAAKCMEVMVHLKADWPLVQLPKNTRKLDAGTSNLLSISRSKL